MELSPDAMPAKPLPLPPATKKAGMSASSERMQSEGKQQLLLGIGLAVAVIALLCVLGLGIVSLTQPVPSSTPKIKAVEDGDGRQVFIIRD
jgi:serine/threonine-protein kinase